MESVWYFLVFFVAQVASLALFVGQDSVWLRGHHFSVAWRCLIAKDWLCVAAQTYTFPKTDD